MDSLLMYQNYNGEIKRVKPKICKECKQTANYENTPFHGRLCRICKNRIQNEANAYRRLEVGSNLKSSDKTEVNKLYKLMERLTVLGTEINNINLDEQVKKNDLQYIQIISNSIKDFINSEFLVSQTSNLSIDDKS